MGKAQSMTPITFEQFSELSAWDAKLDSHREFQLLQFHEARKGMVSESELQAEKNKVNRLAIHIRKQHDIELLSMVATENSTIEEAMQWHNLRHPDCYVCSLLAEVMGVRFLMRVGEENE